MKLKYNQDGKTETIPFSTRKPQGKRLVIHHNEQNHYAKVVPTDDEHASNLPVGVNGEIFAVQSQVPPEILSVNVAPSAVAVMQGQSATATVTAIGNDAVTGLSYGLSSAPTWVTISDDLILIQPSDNDLGIARIDVIGRDIGSDASLATEFLAEAKLRPIIESLSIIPPAVTVEPGSTSTATISAVANEAVTGLSYGLSGASSWITLDDDVIYISPAATDSGSAAVTVTARDTGSSASAAAVFNAEVYEEPHLISLGYLPEGNITVKTDGVIVPITLVPATSGNVNDITYSCNLTDSTIEGNVLKIDGANYFSRNAAGSSISSASANFYVYANSEIAPEKQASCNPRIYYTKIRPNSTIEPAHINIKGSGSSTTVRVTLTTENVYGTDSIPPIRINGRAVNSGFSVLYRSQNISDDKITTHFDITGVKCSATDPVGQYCTIGRNYDDKYAREEATFLWASLASNRSMAVDTILPATSVPSQSG